MGGVTSSLNKVDEWGHPHSTYPQRERGEIKPNAYDCLQEGRGGRVQDCVRAQKKIKFLDHKISKRFVFCTKETMTLPFIIVIEKCKPTLSYN